MAPFLFRDAASLPKCRGLDLTSSVSQGSNLPDELAEQTRVWADAATRAARKNPQRGGRLSFRNLVPVPGPELRPTQSCGRALRKRRSDTCSQNQLEPRWLVATCAVPWWRVKTNEGVRHTRVMWETRRFGEDSRTSSSPLWHA